MTDEHKALIEDAYASSAFGPMFACVGFVAEYVPPPEPEPEEEE